MTDSKQSNPSPASILLGMAAGYSVSNALRVVAELGIADRLKKSPKTCEELAQATSSHAPSLYRLLCTLASYGIFQEDKDGFKNTPLSDALQSDAPNSLRDSIIYMANDGNQRAWMCLADTIRTGNPAFEEANGVTFWEYLQENPKLEHVYNRHLDHFTTDVTDIIIDSYDFSAFKSIVDIGGGQGALLAGILNVYPQLHGLLLEAPSVAKLAKIYIEKLELSNRIDIIAGDFFETIPAGHDAYILKYVLHNWSDEKACKILQKCREAISDHGKLIIFEKLVTPGNEQDPTLWMDLDMMVTLGGLKRTEKAFESLLLDAGFKMTNVSNTELIDIIEAVAI